MTILNLDDYINCLVLSDYTKTELSHLIAVAVDNAYEEGYADGYDDGIVDEGQCQ